MSPIGNLRNLFPIGLPVWAVVLTLVCFSLQAEPTPSESGKNPESEFEITETEVRMPGVTVNRAQQEVRIDASVCLSEGLLEYVVCQPDTYEHESIFTTEADPELIHAALLLCGLKPFPQLRGMGDLWWDKAKKQQHSRVKIEVEWEEAGKTKRINLASLLKARLDQPLRPGGTSVQELDEKLEVEDSWIFSGSFLQTHTETGKPFYAANSTGILVGIWPDPSTIIQYGHPTGDPHRGDNLGLEIHKERVPEEGTKVRLVFSKHNEAGEQPAPKE